MPCSLFSPSLVLSLLLGYTVCEEKRKKINNSTQNCAIETSVRWHDGIGKSLTCGPESCSMRFIEVWSIEILINCFRRLSDFFFPRSVSFAESARWGQRFMSERRLCFCWHCRSSSCENLKENSLAMGEMSFNFRHTASGSDRHPTWKIHDDNKISRWRESPRPALSSQESLMCSRVFVPRKMHSPLINLKTNFRHPFACRGKAKLGHSLWPNIVGFLWQKARKATKSFSFSLEAWEDFYGKNSCGLCSCTQRLLNVIRPGFREPQVKVPPVPSINPKIDELSVYNITS